MARRIARAIENAGLFLFFVTPGSVEREHCQREVSYAIDHDLPFLTVHLEPTSPTGGMGLTLSSIQAILRHETNERDYRRKLLQFAGVHLDRGIATATPTAPPAARFVLSTRNAFVTILIRTIIGGGLGYLVKSLDLPEGSADRSPEFVPGAKAVLFERVPVADIGRIMAVDLATGRETDITAGRYPNIVGRHLIFQKDNAYWSAEIDLDTFELTSEPAMVLAEYGCLDASLTGEVVYARLDDLFGKNVPVLVDPNGVEREIPSLEPGFYGEPVFSPDGKMLAFANDGRGEAPDIWTLTLDDGALNRLTNDDTWRRVPVWSPTGEQIAFTRFSSRPGELVVRASSGLGAATVLGNQGERASRCFDTGELLFSSFGPAKTFIGAIDAGPGAERRVVIESDFATAGGDLSPSGTWIAYGSDRSGRREVYVSPYPDTGRASSKYRTTPLPSLAGRE